MFQSRGALSCSFQPSRHAKDAFDAAQGGPFSGDMRVREARGLAPMVGACIVPCQGRWVPWFLEPMTSCRA